MICHVCGDEIEDFDYWVIALNLSEDPPSNLYAHRPDCLEAWVESQNDGAVVSQPATADSVQLPLTGT